MHKKRLTGPLNSPSGQHLLSQILFIISNTAVPPPYGLVLAHHDVFGNLIQQTNYISSSG